MADNIQGFIKELAFEEALTHHLLDHGWNEVIKTPPKSNWCRTGLTSSTATTER